MDYDKQFNENRVDWLYTVARSKDVGAVAVRVALLFGTFLQPDTRETVRPSYEWIMTEAKIKGRSTLSKALKELEDAGLLVVEREHRYRNTYSFPFDGEKRWVQKLDT